MYVEDVYCKNDWSLGKTLSLHNRKMSILHKVECGKTKANENTLNKYSF